MAEREGIDSASETDRHPATLILSLVIPAFNEEHRLEAGFARLRDAIESGEVPADTTEFILVDDGSTDATVARARALFDQLPHVKILQLEKNLGKGAAVRAGVAAAASPSILFADADMAIDPSQTPQFIEALSVADLAIGSRAASGASVDRPSISRSLMNRIFNRIVNTVTRVSLDDTQCGFKAFRAPAAKLLFHCTATERMAFDVEVLLLARRLGLTINQVPVHWLRVKGSHVRSWSDSVSMVHDVLGVRRSADKVAPLPGALVKLPAPSSDDSDESHPGYWYLKSLSSTLPVIGQGNGTYLVLLPLMDEADVKGLLKEMELKLEGVVPERTMVTEARLRAMAPLALSWDDTAARPRCA